MMQLWNFIATDKYLSQLYDRLQSAHDMQTYWGRKGNRFAASAWGSEIYKLESQLIYIADRLETFANLKPGKVHDNVMVIVGDIRGKLTTVESGAESRQEAEL